MNRRLRAIIVGVVLLASVAGGVGLVVGADDRSTAETPVGSAGGVSDTDTHAGHLEGVGGQTCLEVEDRHTHLEVETADPHIAVNGSHGQLAVDGLDSLPQDATNEDAPLIRESIVLEQRPERPGEFEAVISYDVPEVVTALEISPEADAEVLETTGFAAAGETYEWERDQDETTPEIRLRLDANRTDIDHHARSSERPGVDATAAAHEIDDGYAFAETGEWGIVAVPQVDLAWSQTGSVDATREVTVDGEGTAGEHVAVFGPHETHETSVAGETIRLIVPDAAAPHLADHPAEILETLATASTELRAGGTTQDVAIVAAPPDDVDWGPEGLQYGSSDAWVQADSPLEAAGNVWLHEYVHTRQAYANGEVDTEHRWLIEAQAEYYAATLAYEQGLIEHDEFEAFLAAGEGSPYADGVLADPVTWQDDLTDYVKGPLAYGAVDRELRLATDGEYALADVFRDLNEQEGPVTDELWLEAVEARGGDPVRETAERYAYTEATPEVWTYETHAEAFEGPAPAMAYGPSLGDPITIDGLLEERAADALEPVTVGETVTVPVAVENRGGREGPYRAPLLVDGVPVDTANGTLEAGDSAVESLAWTPEEPGRYTLHVGDHPVTVDVLEPADPRVTALEATPDEVEPGEPVTVSATVENDADRIAETTLEFHTAAGVIAEERVVLGPGETTTVEVELTFDERAAHEVGVGDASVTVTVDEDLATQAGEGLEALPGFGAVVTMVALGAALLVAARRQF